MEEADAYFLVARWGPGPSRMESKRQFFVPHFDQTLKIISCRPIKDTKLSSDAFVEELEVANEPLG